MFEKHRLSPKPLDLIASDAAGEFSRMFPSPERAQAILRSIFPDLVDAKAADANSATLQDIVARSVKANVDEGSELSLEAALSVVHGLRNLLAAKQLLGKRMIGLDAKIFEGKDLGTIPAPPGNIIDILESQCPILGTGHTVARRHRLTFVPRSINGELVTINYLRKISAQLASKRGPIFEEQKWYNNEAWVNQPLEQSTWVLSYETITPNTENKPDSTQAELVERVRHHRTARLLEHVGTLVFNELEYRQRLFADVEGRCIELSSKKSHVSAGAFSATGIRIYDYPPKVLDPKLGTAIVWDFSD